MLHHWPLSEKSWRFYRVLRPQRRQNQRQLWKRLLGVDLHKEWRLLWCQGRWPILLRREVESRLPRLAGRNGHWRLHFNCFGLQVEASLVDWGWLRWRLEIWVGRLFRFCYQLIHCFYRRIRLIWQQPIRWPDYPKVHLGEGLQCKHVGKYIRVESHRLHS